MNRPSGPVRQSQMMRAAETRGTVLPERGSDAYLRVGGRQLIILFSGAMRSLKLYPVTNAVVQTALADLASLVAEMAEAEGDVELRASGEFLFINGTRLRLDLDNYANFNALLSAFRMSGVGSIRMSGKAVARDWTVLLSSLANAGGEPADRYTQLGERLAQSGVDAFELAPQTETSDEPEKAENKEKAKRTYAQGVAATKDVINSVRMGQSPNIKKIKRVVQGIVDQILNEETSLVGLTTLRDYDEYTFTLCVNVYSS